MYVENFSVFLFILQQFQPISSCTLVYISSVLFNFSTSGFILSYMPFYALCKAIWIAFEMFYINKPALPWLFIKWLWNYKA